MKKALVSFHGYVGKVVDPGEETEIYEGPDATFLFVDAPDEIQMDWTLEYSPSRKIMVWVERDGPFTDNNVARSVAYGTVGQQLDMLYHDIRVNGQIDQNSQWFQHVSNVKEMIEKPPAPGPILTPEQEMIRAETDEPHPSKMGKQSSMEMQCWRRYPGWKGYSGDVKDIVVISPSDPVN